MPQNTAATTSLVGHTVTIVRGVLATRDNADTGLMVLAERPRQYRPAPWHEPIPSFLYKLGWPDGTVTWNERWEFEPARKAPTLRA
jgi:hypothetical protein